MLAHPLGQLGVFLTLGFGRIVIEDTEAPNMLVSWYEGDEWRR